MTTSYPKTGPKKEEKVPLDMSCLIHGWKTTSLQQLFNKSLAHTSERTFMICNLNTSGNWSYSQVCLQIVFCYSMIATSSSSSSSSSVELLNSCLPKESGGGFRIDDELREVKADPSTLLMVDDVVVSVVKGLELLLRKDAYKASRADIKLFPRLGDTCVVEVNGAAKGLSP